MSVDGAAVVIHDDVLERTTNGRGRVERHTSEYLRSLDAGSWSDPAYAGEQIPTLTEILDRYGQSARLHLELKSEQSQLPAAVHDLIVDRQQIRITVDSFDVPGVTITSFHLDQLRRSIELWKQPRPPHHWLCRSSSSQHIKTSLSVGIDGICPPARSVTPEFVETATDAGLQVRCWGVRDLDDLRRAFEAGVSGATVDWPDIARDHIASWDLHEN